MNGRNTRAKEVTGRKAVSVKFAPSNDTASNYAQLARVADRLLTPIAVIGPDSTLKYANRVAATLFETDPLALVGRKMISLVHPDDRERTVHALAEISHGDPEGGFTQFRIRATSSQPWHVIDCYAHNLSDDPDVRGILVSGGDVSERVTLARALRTLSRCSDIVVQANDESTLTSNICRTIVESGGYVVAWVGYLEHDADKTVRVVDSYGNDEFLEGITVSWGDNQYGHGPTGNAIRSGSLQVLKDIRRSKRAEPWRDRLNGHEIRTSCSFPLIVDGEPIGALSIYASEMGVFGAAELELLSKLADNLAYGIGRIRDAQRLATSEERLREAERLAHLGHWEWDLHSNRFEFLADEMFRIYGVSPAQWDGSFESLLSYVEPGERSLVRGVFNKAVTHGFSEIAHRIIRPDGEVRTVRLRAEAVHDDEGGLARVVGTCQDVTEYSDAKVQLAQSRQFLLAITDNMAEGMIATDAAGTITFANRAAGTLIGIVPTELVGLSTKDAFRFRHDDQRDDSIPCPLSTVWSEGRTLNLDHETIVRRDGSLVPMALSASPLKDDDQRGAVIVFEDITDRAAAQLKVERELEKLSWVGRIRDALDNDRFVLYSQPIVDLANEEVVQHELLIRMISAEGDVIMPDTFLPTAEEYGLISEIDRWVIRETARLSAAGHPLEFNLSAKSVADPGILALIADAINEHGANPSQMICEITETALVHDLGAAEQFVQGMNDLGIKVALDDFGAGYGGFAYLKRLSVSYLKIDREFVQDLCREMSSQHVVSAVVNLAKAFGMRTVAEGAEDRATVELLKNLGVNYVQGYVIGRPSPARDSLFE
jgi:PAS domain S-box-containing protein